MIPELFSGVGLSQNTVWIVLGIAVVIYLYLWFYNTEMALNITYGIGRLIQAVTIGLVKVLIVVFSAIGRGLSNLFRRLFK